MRSARPLRTHRAAIRRTGLVTGLLTTLVLLPAAAAQAHVHVVPDSTASGSASRLTFRVPTESDTASTVKLAVRLPQDTPLVSVSDRSLPGWTIAITDADLPTPVSVGGATITKAPRTVTWTASERGIPPGQYGEFVIQVRPLPAVGELSLPTTQTYSDGTVVKWDQPTPTPASGTEPEHPAPSFVVTAADSAGASAASDHHSDQATGATSDQESDGSWELWLGGGALVVALAAAAMAGLAWRAARA